MGAGAGAGARARAGGEGQLAWGWGGGRAIDSSQASAPSDFIPDLPRSPSQSPSSASRPHPYTPLTLLPCLQGPRHQDSSVGGWRAWAPQTPLSDLLSSRARHNPR